MPFQVTRPTGDQLRFESSKTGNHVLDDYLEAAEKGNRTLGDMLNDLFDPVTGLLRDLATPQDLANAIVDAQIAAGQAQTSAGQASTSASQAAASAASVNPANFVQTTGDQTVGGIKTFSAAPQVPTAANKNATASAASTEFVDRYRSLLAGATAGTGTLSIEDRGSLVNASGGITVPQGIFNPRDVITIINVSAGNITITQGASLTMRQAGTPNTGNRTLASRGMVTIVFTSSSECYISGAGLS